jgi:SNF family Na+-dependent transporter
MFVVHHLLDELLRRRATEEVQMSDKVWTVIGGLVFGGSFVALLYYAVVGGWAAS